MYVWMLTLSLTYIFFLDHIIVLVNVFLEKTTWFISYKLCLLEPNWEFFNLARANIWLALSTTSVHFNTMTYTVSISQQHPSVSYLLMLKLLLLWFVEGNQFTDSIKKKHQIKQFSTKLLLIGWITSDIKWSVVLCVIGSTDLGGCGDCRSKKFKNFD